MSETIKLLIDRPDRPPSEFDIVAGVYTVGSDDDKILQFCSTSKDPAVCALVTVKIENHPNSPYQRGDKPRDKRCIVVNRAAWMEYAEEQKQEAERLDAEAAELEAAGEKARRELDKMLAALVP